MNTEESGGGLRERKKRETRIALSWAAVRLAVERGLANVRIEDIAAEAGVSPRTFNNYFSGKAEAIAARHVERARRIADELRARPAGEPLWEAVEGAAIAGFALGLDEGGEHVPNEQWTAGLRLMLAEPSLQGEFLKANAAAEAEFTAAVAERTGTDAGRDLYPGLVSAAVGGAIAVVIGHYMKGGGPGVPARPLLPMLRDALRQLAEGLPEPGRDKA